MFSQYRDQGDECSTLSYQQMPGEMPYCRLRFSAQACVDLKCVRGTSIGERFQASSPYRHLLIITCNKACCRVNLCKKLDIFGSSSRMSAFWRTRPSKYSEYGDYSAFTDTRILEHLDSAKERPNHWQRPSTLIVMNKAIFPIPHSSDRDYHWRSRAVHLT